MESESVVAALAKLGERIDGTMSALGLLRVEMRSEFRDLHVRFDEHVRDTDRRFNAAAVIADTKVGEVYRVIEDREHKLVMRLLGLGGLVVTALGTFASIVFYIIPAMLKSWSK